jgi:ATP-binding cassette, subfamily B, bacterial
LNINKETLKLYWKHIRRYKLSFFTMLISIPIAALLLYTALPYFLSQAVGTLPNSGEGMGHYLLLASIATIVGVGLNLLGFQSAVRHESAVRQELVDDTFNRLIHKDHDFFANQKIGALTSKFIDFINTHVGLQDLFILRTLSFIFSVGAGLVIIFLSVPLLGFIMLGLIAWLLIQVRISLKLRGPYREERKKLIAEVNGAAADAISGNLTVKTFAHENFERSALRKITEKYRRSHIKDFTYLSIEGSSRLLLMSIVQIVAVGFIAYLLVNKQMELGIAVFTIAYMQRLAGQLFELGELINGYDKYFLQAAPMTEILLEDDIIIDQPNAKQLVVHRGEITFDHATYAYADAKDRLVINDLNFSIKPGQKVGLVGHSGAGKTTVTKLLLRFADLDSGSLLIDGQNIKKVTQSSLRENVAYVPQEPMLFHRSLRENIAYGKLDATEAEIRNAAKRANALGFIDDLPHGFDTIVGERGVKLSGGQRQRIAIARAILKDAPILILDEATSALDSESEKLIQDALEKLMKGRTSIVIAHRLSTIAKLDRIIVLDSGKIVEDGSHAELLKNGRIYATLWNHQSGGFLEE